MFYNNTKITFDALHVYYKAQYYESLIKNVVNSMKTIYLSINLCLWVSYKVELLQYGTSCISTYWTRFLNIE